MDYRKFLQAERFEVLPWLGGDRLVTPARELRLTQRPPALGWYRFSVKGRVATVEQAEQTPPLQAFPAVRGCFAQGVLFCEGARPALVQLLPADAPPRFSPLLARRWPSGDLLFDSLEFEGEVEGALRERLGTSAPLVDLKGVSAVQRAAYGAALLERAGQARQVRFSALEVRARLAAVAEGGLPAAHAALDALEAERAQTRREQAALDAEAARAHALGLRAQALAQRANRAVAVQELAEHALGAAGAQLEEARLTGEGHLEVTFRFMGHRFICVADPVSLQVIDSGICLGHPPRDDLLTLDSLPGVIQEAIETDALVILRWP